MNLAELLNGLVNHLEKLDLDKDIKGLALDSRKVKSGYLFIALDGAKEHGLNYLKQAFDNGAFAVIYDPSGSEMFEIGLDQRYLLAVQNLGIKLGSIAARFFSEPSKKLDVIGITGTNGKTTCTQFLLQLLPESAVIGTLGWGDKVLMRKTLNTTPDALAIQEMLASFVKLKKQTLIMEVSSHGLQQGRVNGVDFKGAVFLNLSRDHLDYHGSMEAYLKAKLALFEKPELQFVIVNSDDCQSKVFLSVANEKAKAWAFSLSGKKTDSAENVNATEIKADLTGCSFILVWNEEQARVETNIVGEYNLENILAVMTVLLAMGCPIDVVAQKVNGLVPVCGRMQGLGEETSPYIFVDYAHTPDALEKVLQGLSKQCEEKLRLVFGCGGDRDKGKRAQMGAIAEQYADQVIITDDNPRFENPEQIIEDIKMGFKGKNFEVIQNRECAIQTVIKNATINDCIVITGKGHENYQDVKGIKHDFSDQEIVKRTLREFEI